MLRRVLSIVLGIAMFLALEARAQADFTGGLSDEAQWVDLVAISSYSAQSVELEASVAWTAETTGGTYYYRLVVEWLDASDSSVLGPFVAVQGQVQPSPPPAAHQAGATDQKFYPPSQGRSSSYRCRFTLQYSSLKQFRDTF